MPPRVAKFLAENLLVVYLSGNESRVAGRFGGALQDEDAGHHRQGHQVVVGRAFDRFDPR